MQKITMVFKLTYSSIQYIFLFLLFNLMVKMTETFLNESQSIRISGNLVFSYKNSQTKTVGFGSNKYRLQYLYLYPAVLLIFVDVC